jgi:hypothetical protein
MAPREGGYTKCAWDAALAAAVLAAIRIAVALWLGLRDSLIAWLCWSLRRSRSDRLDRSRGSDILDNLGPRRRIVQEGYRRWFPPHPFSCSSVICGMRANIPEAVHYRLEAAKCREAAGNAKDSASRLYWQQAERCWLTLANQAEVTVNLLSGRNSLQGCNTPARLKNGQWE